MSNKIDSIGLMEAERLVYALVKQSLSPEDYSRIEQELRNYKITIYGRTYQLANTSEEIQKILSLSWDMSIKVKASATSDDKIRLDIYLIGETLEQKVVEEKKLQGLSRALIYKLVRVQKKATVKNIFTGEVWEEYISVATFEDRFEDFITGQEINFDQVPETLGVRVVNVVAVPNPHNITQGYLQKIYVFSDGAVAEFWGYKIASGRKEGDLSALESLYAGGEGYEEPIFVFRNKDVNRIWKKIYMKAIELYHKWEAEEWRRKREEWKREIEDAQKRYQQKTDDIISFLRSKRDGISKQELEWLKSRSPIVRDFYVYCDLVEGIEVIWMVDEVSVNIRGEKFKIPIR